MKTKPRIRQNKDKLSYMENTPVGQLIWEMSAPSIVGVLAYNAYNLFDTLFISQWAGTAAVGGVSVSFPFFLFCPLFPLRWAAERHLLFHGSLAGRI